jgi:hypothetical protein
MNQIQYFLFVTEAMGSFCVFPHEERPGGRSQELPSCLLCFTSRLDFDFGLFVLRNKKYARVILKGNSVFI